MKHLKLFNFFIYTQMKHLKTYEDINNKWDFDNSKYKNI